MHNFMEKFQAHINKNTVSRLILFSSCIFLSSCGPKDYDDCILKNLKDAKDEVAARLIQNACYSKFHEETPTKECKKRDLSEVEKSRVQVFYTGTSTGSNPYLKFSIYNGNESITLKNWKLEISAQNFPAPQYYSDSIGIHGISPNSGGDDLFPVTVFPSGEWNYKVISIQGCVN